MMVMTTTVMMMMMMMMMMMIMMMINTVSFKGDRLKMEITFVLIATGVDVGKESCRVLERNVQERRSVLLTAREETSQALCVGRVLSRSLTDAMLSALD